MKDVEQTNKENIEKDYILENERRKKAVQKEEEFLRKDVIGKGSPKDTEQDFQNEQTDMEKGLEKH